MLKQSSNKTQIIIVHSNCDVNIIIIIIYIYYYLYVQKYVCALSNVAYNVAYNKTCFM